MQDRDSTVSFCPSFSVYCSDQLATIAAKVSETEQNNESKQIITTSPGDPNDDDFEFVPVHANPDACRSLPLFNVDLLLDHRRRNLDDSPGDLAPSVESQLMKLFIEDDRDLPSSSSSSEAEEMEGAKSGTYCVWKPKSSPSPSRCEKSSSTGSSWKQRSWRLRDLLRRSRSDGKYSLTHLSNNPSNYGNNNSRNKINKETKLGKKKEITKVEKGKRTAPAAKAKAATANEVFYGRSKASGGGEKRKSYLPYRQDLFALSVNVHGLAKTFPPF